MTTLTPTQLAEIEARATTTAMIGARQVVDKILRDVAELPDRTSPADRPEMMLVTTDELALIAGQHIDGSLTWASANVKALLAHARALEAENARLRAAHKRADDGYTRCFRIAVDWQDKAKELEAERDRLKAANERMKGTLDQVCRDCAKAALTSLRDDLTGRS